MSKEWYLFDKPQVTNSGFERDEFFDYAADSFNEVLEESMLGEDVVLYQNGGLNEDTAVHIKAIVQGNTPDNESKFEVRNILCHIGTLKIGNYVKYKGRIWLITEPPGDNQIYEKAVMQHCNYNLKWVNQNGDIIERCCVFKDASYSSGISENKSLILGDMRVLLYMPKDNETVRITRDRRFIIDDFAHAQLSTPTVFKVTKTNFVQKNEREEAVLIATLEEDGFNSSRDNRELMIADYYNLLHQYTLETITPASVEVEKDNTLQIQVIAKRNGVETTSGIVYTSSDETVVKISPEGILNGIDEGTATISISFYSASPITLSVTVVDNVIQNQNSVKITYTGTSSIRVGGAAKTYTANFYNAQGQPMSDIAVWTVYAEGSTGVPSYITITEQTATTIKLQAKNDYSLIGRKIYLKLTNTSELTSDILEIQLISLT